jgi:hypothetical protein
MPEAISWTLVPLVGLVIMGRSSVVLRVGDAGDV